MKGLASGGRSAKAVAVGGRRGPRGGGVAAGSRRGSGGNWWESGTDLNNEVFDLRREERSRARGGQGEDYDSRLNQRLRSSVASSSPSYDPVEDEEEEDSQNRGLLKKIGQAWRIFFPEKKRNLSNMPAREAAKSRLKMILVADRNSLSEEVQEDMKQTIVNALKDYVELGDRDINLSINNKGDDGTEFSVSVPVKCVKPDKRSYFSPDGIVDDGEVQADNWDDWDDNPDSRFPWGT